ncbi:hypothetical protein SH467x_001237 [Pirellulaceae bacterium SH467]
MIEVTIETFAHDYTGEPPEPATPTGARPGSFEKVQVMRERASRGEQLFHPQDATDPLLRENRFREAMRSA